MKKYLILPLLLLLVPVFGRSQGCIDPTDLTSPNVTGYYGTFQNPYQHVGIVNYGSNSSSSRHTVHTSTSEMDPRTNGMLHTVPPGATASVRLGNWSTGAQAEALRYKLVVDTLVSDLLILKYAAVLQNPNHNASRQPRFRLEILNANQQVIDPVCGVSDFISNSALGWNVAGYGSNVVLWKDWTNVGIDLSPFAGQTIYIRLTTYDCSENGHYGYAYFTLECSRKSMQSMSCGEVGPNSFTAPTGFTYAWYTDPVSQSVISTGRTLYTTGSEGVEFFYCRLSFVDKPGCNFTMNAYAGARYPLALFDTVVTPQTCGYDVSFLNRSVLSPDGINPLGNGEGCENALWDFGDGTSSTQYHATHYYANGGDYTVTLVSGLANNACTDTMQMLLHLPSLDTIAYIDGPSERCTGTSPDTLVIVGTSSSSWTGNRRVVSPSATTTYSADVVDTRGCPVTLSHTLTVNPSHHFSNSASVCFNQLPYTFDTLTLFQPSGTQSHTVTYTNRYGCDSTLTLALTVKDTSRRDTVADVCDEILWQGQYFSSSVDSASVRRVNAVGCDSVVVLHLTVRYSSSSTVADTVIENHLPHTYHGRTFFSDVTNTSVVFPNAVGCDSVVDYSLLVRWNVTVAVDTSVCANHLPISWGRLTFHEPGTQRDTLLNQYGADSIVIMTLQLFPIYDDTLAAEICDRRQYAFGDHFYTTTGLYTDHLYSLHGCDSLSTLNLLVHPRPLVSIKYDSVCQTEQYKLWMETDAPFTRWYSFPHDPLLDGHIYDDTVLVAPMGLTAYVAWGDVTEEAFCPETDTLKLNHLVGVRAELKVTPGLLEVGNLDYIAYDVSHNNEQRAWYVDWEPLLETGYSIRGRADSEADSLIIALEHYNDQCHDTAVAVIPISHFALYPPNVFTPLEASNNRFFIPSTDILDAELFLYNRQGQLVYQTTDIEQGWDGRDTGGNLCPQGAYVWRLYFHSTDHPKQLRTAFGTVLLLR